MGRHQLVAIGDEIAVDASFYLFDCTHLIKTAASRITAIVITVATSITAMVSPRALFLLHPHLCSCRAGSHWAVSSLSLELRTFYERSSFGVVVMTVKVVRVSPSGFFQTSHSPAKASSDSSALVM